MKAWVDDLDSHVDHWSAKLDKTGRGWWPQFVYHFTDVQNARSILNSGEILSRQAAIDADCMLVDNANLSVIAGTPAEHLRFVRLFFRPRTPTQYRNEGIKPRGRTGDGHCPVPIFFLFDFKGVVGRDTTRFSRGTMANSRHGHSDRRDYFRRIEFEDVYHDAGLGLQETPRKRQIIQTRHAEVLVPDRLPLDSDLRVVYCRSEAERSTLLSGLEPAARRTWADNIRLGVDYLFFRRRPHIKLVSGFGRLITLEFNTSAGYSQTLQFRFATHDGRRYEESLSVPPGHTLKKVRLEYEERGGHLTLHLEGALAFDAEIDLSDLPF